MKKEPGHNSTDSVEIEALIIRLELGQLCDEDAQRPVNKVFSCFI